MGNLNNKKKVRVLEIAHGLAPGGIESFLINVFENIDRDKIEINFALACEGKQFYEDKVISEGAKVYHTSDLICTVISLEKSEKQWAELINNYINSNNFNKDIIEDRVNSFNIKNVVKDIEKIYLQA